MVNYDVVEVEEEKEQVLGCCDEDVVWDGWDEVKPGVEGKRSMSFVMKVNVLGWT